MKTVEWHRTHDGPQVWLIDQTRLPLEEVVVRCSDYRQVAHAIKSMQVRGAPAIGVTAAMGVALAAHQAPEESAGFADFLARAYDELGSTRPTAVNLFWAIERMRGVASALAGRPAGDVRRALEAEALRMAEEDEQRNRQIGAHGEPLFGDGDGVLTHCNAGALATVAYGTAIGPLRAAHEAGKRFHVFVDETRPFLQGSRLTAWELLQAGIDCTLITDNMAAHFMGRGQVQKVIVGADRIAANGDVANKIGTYGVAILAQAHGIPFYVAAPTSTIDLSLPSGDLIPIEERSPDEVTQFREVQVAPPGMKAAHPAFDVTPNRYVTAIITEMGVHYPPFEPALREAVERARENPTPFPSPGGRGEHTAPPTAPETQGAPGPSGGMSASTIPVSPSLSEGGGRGVGSQPRSKA